MQVAWLDELAAKARFGRWLDGRFPSFVPFPKTGKARKGSKATVSAGGGVERPPAELIRLKRLRQGSAVQLSDAYDHG